MNRLWAAILITFAVIIGAHAMMPHRYAGCGYDAGPAVLSNDISASAATRAIRESHWLRPQPVGSPCEVLQLRLRPSSNGHGVQIPENIVIVLQRTAPLPDVGWFEVESASCGSCRYWLLGYVDGTALYAGFFAMKMGVDPEGLANGSPNTGLCPSAQQIAGTNFAVGSYTAISFGFLGLSGRGYKVIISSSCTKTADEAGKCRGNWLDSDCSFKLRCGYVCTVVWAKFKGVGGNMNLNRLIGVINAANPNGWQIPNVGTISFGYKYMGAETENVEHKDNDWVPCNCCSSGKYTVGDNAP